MNGSVVERLRQSASDAGWGMSEEDCAALLSAVEALDCIAHGRRPAGYEAWTGGRSWRIQLARDSLAALEKADSA